MPVRWRGFGPEVLLELDRSASESLRSQVQRQLRDAIRANRLAHEERLPSSRSLAAQLRVSRGVISESYAQLESEGYLEPRVGSGTHVTRLWSETPGSVAQLDSDEEPTVAGVEVDFEFGVPDVALFPMRDWLWALSAASRQLTTVDLGDEHGPGQAHLRGVVAAYLRRVRASSVTSDRVVVCPGFRHGLNIVLRALCQIGIDMIALEDPGPVGHDSIAARSGLRSVAIGVDHDGIDIDALETSGARAVVVTPAHQAPTGVLLTSDRRGRLVEWARRVDGYVIEDDYDAEFRYDRQPVGSLQGLAPDRVIAMGSVSKTLSPMLRLGWIIPPPALVSAVCTEKLLLGRGAPALDQVALALLIESGRFDRHVRLVRRTYARRRQTLVDALAHHAPGIAVSGLAAGTHAVVHLPAGSERDVIAGCAERSVRVYGMSRYRSDGATEPAQLVIGFGPLPQPVIERGVDTLGKVIRSS